MRHLRGEGRQAHGDVLRPGLPHAVAHPLTRPGEHRLPGPDLQGPAVDSGQARLSWEALLAIMGAGDRAAGRDEVVSLLTLDQSDPASVLFCVSSAREGARRVRSGGT